jgi:hypothetical protein
LFLKKNIFLPFFKTEKEDQSAHTGQDRDAQQHASDSHYYDDGPSMMPASESFAGNQDNWGASATEGWGVTSAGAGAGAGTGTADINDWTAPAAGTTGTSTNWA